MTEVNKDNVIIIKAGGKSFPYNGIVKEGYNMETPYYEKGIISRILREICFRIPFLPKKIWFNKKICNYDIQYVLIWDPLITVDFLLWISEKFPQAQLNFCYDNLVGKARHLLPNQIPLNYKIWSYDKNDCEKYNLHLTPTTYCTAYLKPKKETKYDVLFVGRDKGRASFLLDFEQKMKDLGLRTCFVITKDGRFSKQKSFYEKEISYEEIIDLITQSRSILNVALPGQVGITVRDLESLFMGVKLLTTNKYIKNADFYHKDNIFIIDEDYSPNKILDFINRPYVEISKEVKNKHVFSYFIQKVTQNV